MEENKIKKSFKDYYKNEDYKKKHLEYIKEKITCDCGCQVTRVGMCKHKRNEKHNKIMNNIKKNEDERLNKIIDEKIQKLMQEKFKMN